MNQTFRIDLSHQRKTIGECVDVKADICDGESRSGDVRIPLQAVGHDLAILCISQADFLIPRVNSHHSSVHGTILIQQIGADNICIIALHIVFDDLRNA